MKIGDLVRVKNYSSDQHDYGVVLKIKGRFKYAEVYWIMSGACYPFFLEDLEVINEDG